MAGYSSLFAGLTLDAAAESERIAEKIREIVADKLKRQGIIVALSGGIDSSTVAALCVKALGPEKVFGLHMPERHSSDDTLSLSRLVSDGLGIDSEHINISPVLESLGCYEKQDAAFRKVLPEYGPGWKSKIVLPSVLEGNSLRIFSLVAISPEGEEIKKRLSRGGLPGGPCCNQFQAEGKEDA